MTLGRIAMLRGDKAEAEKQYQTLMVSRREPHVVLELLALLADFTGHREKAVEHFEQALAVDRERQERADIPHTCWEYAELLVRRGAAGDREKAKALLEEGLVTSRALGTRPWTERMEALQRQLAERS